MPTLVMKRNSCSTSCDVLQHHSVTIQCLIQELRPLLPDEEQANIDLIYVNAKNLVPFGLSQDFRDVPANGVRTVFKLAATWLDMILAEKERGQDVNKFLPIIHLLSSWFIYLVKVRDGEDSPKRLLSFLYHTFNEDAFKLIHGYHFYVKNVPSLKLFLTIAYRLILLKTSHGIWEPIKYSFICGRKNLAHHTARNYHRLNVISNFTGILRSLSPVYIRKQTPIFHFMMSCCKPRVSYKRHKLKIPSNFTVNINIDGCELQASEPGSNNKVKFGVLRDPSSNDYTNKLLIYVYGGAFLGPKVEALDHLFVKDWCNKIPGLTILSIDYSVAPENPFPKALLEILDIYLWILKGGPQVKEVVGFIPDEIAASGDSSGGNLIASLIVSLNELRRMGRQDLVTMMPSSLLLFYPKAFLDYNASPSFILSHVDAMLNVFSVNAVARAYVPFKHRDKNGNWHVVQDNSTIPAGEWIDMDDYEFIQSHLLSPAKYEKWADLSDMKLFCMGIEFDGLLDEAVHMAKVWKGPVDFRVIREAIHACHIFHHFSDAGKDVIDTAADMIREAFDGEKNKLPKDDIL